MNANETNLESVIRGSSPDVGFPTSEVIPCPNGWSLGTGVPLAAAGAGIAGAANVASSIRAVVWDAAATTTNPISRGWTLPPEFKTKQGSKDPKILLLVRTRLTDLTGAGSNDDLTLKCQCYWFNTSIDDAEATPESLATPLSIVVGATNELVADLTGTKYQVFDITGGMTDAQLAALAALDKFDITLYPGEVVGANCQLELLNTVLIYDRFATIPDGILGATNLTTGVIDRSESSGATIA